MNQSRECDICFFFVFLIPCETSKNNDEDDDEQAGRKEGEGGKG